MFARIATVSRWMTTFGGYRRDTETATAERRNIATGGVRLVEANTNGERPNRILVVQNGVNAKEAKVHTAHAAPWGLCDNLVNALKLLANQQKDGDSPIQSIVAGPHERSRRGIMDGLRRFIQRDNRCAVDVGDLRRGTRSPAVQKPQFGEAFPEATIREGADELTLRADEVGTQRAFINTEHIEFERWGPPLGDADWHVNKRIQGKEWEELYCHASEK